MEGNWLDSVNVSLFVFHIWFDNQVLLWDEQACLKLTDQPTSHQNGCVMLIQTIKQWSNQWDCPAGIDSKTLDFWRGPLLVLTEKFTLKRWIEWLKELDHCEGSELHFLDFLSPKSSVKQYCCYNLAMWQFVKMLNQDKLTYWNVEKNAHSVKNCKIVNLSKQKTKKLWHLVMFANNWTPAQ